VYLETPALLSIASRLLAKLSAHDWSASLFLTISCAKNEVAWTFFPIPNDPITLCTPPLFRGLLVPNNQGLNFFSSFAHVYSLFRPPMIPFLHLGPLTIPTFGLMVATALFVSAYVLQADFDRRRPQLEKHKGYAGKRDEGFLVIGIAGIVGLAGARLYHVLESPGEFFADPWPQLFSRFGFAWFGGFLGGFVALLFLARRLKIPVLEFLDICSPAACVGYAIGRIGCLLSGDGDYGMPTSLPWGMSFPNGVVPTTQRVHPTPLYEFFIWLAIAAVLWRMGAKYLREPTAKGEIFSMYLVLTGIARFLIEFIRINPRSFFGMSNAQAASLVSIALGVALLLRLKSQSGTLRKIAAA
jgi:phosphatidylglycerol:prolipoprotein diacylglycerol transferase